jgi:hypothetical protein
MMTVGGDCDGDDDNDGLSDDGDDDGVVRWGWR